MIRSGGQKLSDFLVWQSVYSELYFTDVNWNNVRKIDLMRVIRDFQKRQRRYGK
ncbi:undecaprenyl diphosphate synthase family protein [Methanosarcina horonobensis]|nr:undecaprenyl diphosphate synthase family protein [Methanosarcina horonobensis]